MQRRLKELVGDQHWKKAHDYLAAAVSKISSDIPSALAAATTTTAIVASSPSLSSASLAAANSSTATTNAVQMEAQQQEAAEKAALVQRTQIDEAQIETVDEEKFLIVITYLEWTVRIYLDLAPINCRWISIRTNFCFLFNPIVITYLYFTLFISFLLQNDKILRQQALIIIEDYKERNKRQEPGYENPEPMRRRLKELVGDQRWKQVNDSFMYVLIEYLKMVRIYWDLILMHLLYVLHEIANEFRSVRMSVFFSFYLITYLLYFTLLHFISAER